MVVAAVAGRGRGALLGHLPRRPTANGGRAVLAHVQRQTAATQAVKATGGIVKDGRLLGKRLRQLVVRQQLLHELIGADARRVDGRLAGGQLLPGHAAAAPVDGLHGAPRGLLLRRLVEEVVVVTMAAPLAAHYPVHAVELDLVHGLVPREMKKKKLDW